MSKPEKQLGRKQDEQQSLIERRRLRRKVQGIAAALLPYRRGRRESRSRNFSIT